MKYLVFVALSLTLACAKAPPNLSPEATVAFTGTQAVRALDLLRDTAITAHDQVPPLLSESTTRQVVLYHQSTVKIIQTTPGGWKVTAQTGLDELLKNLSEKDKQLLSPYVALFRSILAEVVK